MESIVTKHGKEKIQRVKKKLWMERLGFSMGIIIYIWSKCIRIVVRKSQGDLIKERADKHQGKGMYENDVNTFRLDKWVYGQTDR